MLSLYETFKCLHMVRVENEYTDGNSNEDSSYVPWPLGDIPILSSSFSHHIDFKSIVKSFSLFHSFLKQVSLKYSGVTSGNFHQ